MFSGIVEEMATPVALRNDKENVDSTLTCSFTNELKIDQSVSHNGMCLTVAKIDGQVYGYGKERNPRAFEPRTAEGG